MNNMWRSFLPCSLYGNTFKLNYFHYLVILLQNQKNLFPLRWILKRLTLSKLLAISQRWAMASSWLTKSTLAKGEVRSSLPVASSNSPLGLEGLPPGEQDLGRVDQGEGVRILINSFQVSITSNLGTSCCLQELVGLCTSIQEVQHGQVLEGRILCRRYYAARSVPNVVLETPFLVDSWTGDRATGLIAVFQFAPDTLM